MAKSLDYLDITKEEFWKLPRFDNSLPKGRKGKRWRKQVKNGWLVGEYIKEKRGAPLTVQWYMADTSGEFQKVLYKDW